MSAVFSPPKLVKCHADTVKGALFSSTRMATPMEEDPPVIDEDMQSRQMAVYGRESMQKLAKASILISGLNGLGAEIAKNVILSNPAAVSAAAHALQHATAAHCCAASTRLARTAVAPRRSTPAVRR